MRGTTVTVLIPARNEEADLEHCLRGVLAQDYPHEDLEVIVVDGSSSDGTTAVATAVLSGQPVSWQIVGNPRATTPSSLNAGLRVASGEFICRVDARSVIPPDYIRRCAAILRRRPEVVVVGGTQLAAPRPAASAVERGIARALNNAYAMGASRYRRGASSGPSDTVYLGFFRTSDLRGIDGWDERFPTNQDFELNRRMSTFGDVWFDSGLRVSYLPRSTLGSLAEQYFRFGRWKTRYWRRTDDGPRPRQLMFLAALPSAALAALLVARRRKAVRWLPVTALASTLALDAFGCRGGPGDLRARVAAVPALAVVPTAWWCGVVVEQLRGDRRP